LLNLNRTTLIEKIKRQNLQRPNSWILPYRIPSSVKKMTKIYNFDIFGREN
jgi:hypothetical protein